MLLSPPTVVGHACSDFSLEKILKSLTPFDSQELLDNDRVAFL